jgi:hypothetical protein
MRAVFCIETSGSNRVLRLANGFRPDVNQHVRPQIQGLDGHLGDQAVHFVSQRLISGRIENVGQTRAWTQADVTRRISAHDQSIPERISPAVLLLKVADVPGLPVNRLTVKCTHDRDACVGICPYQKSPLLLKRLSLSPLRVGLSEPCFAFFFWLACSLINCLRTRATLHAESWCFGINYLCCSGRTVTVVGFA